MTTPRVRVAVVTDALQVWGAETSLILLLREFRRNNVDVTTLVHPSSPLLHVAEIGEVRAAPMARRRMRDAGGLKLVSGAAVLDGIGFVAGGFRLAQELRQYDVIVCFGTWEVGQVAIASKLARRPCVLDLHETFAGERGLRLLSKVVRPLAGVIATSEAVVPHDLPRENVRVIGRPVPRVADSASEAVENDLAALHVVMPGQVVPHKRVADAVRQVARSNASLTVVGMSDSVTAYEAEVRREVLAAGDRVALLERTNDIGQYYKRADVVVNLSEHEAFGRTLIEGMTWGCWPIAVAGGAPALLLRRLGVGTVIDAVEDLPSVLNALAHRNALEKEAHERAAREAALEFAPSAIADRYYSAVVEFASRASRVRRRRKSRPAGSIRVLASPGREGGDVNPYSRLVVDALPDDVDVRSFSWSRALGGRYDVVHVHWPEALIFGTSRPSRLVKRVLFRAFLARLQLGIGVGVWTVHNPVPHEKVSKAEERLLSLWKRTSVLHIHMTADTVDRAGSPAERVRLIPHGPYPRGKRLSPERRDPAAPVLAFGAVRKYKGFVELAAEWTAKLQDRKLVIAGEGVDREITNALRELARQHENFDFREGRLSESDLEDLVDSCSAVILPYDEISNSGVALYALSHARPIIATTSSAIRDLQREAGTGWVQTIRLPLAAEELEGAIVRLSVSGSATPDLSGRDWAKIGLATRDAYVHARSRRGVLAPLRSLVRNPRSS